MPEREKQKKEREGEREKYINTYKSILIELLVKQEQRHEGACAQENTIEYEAMPARTLSVILISSARARCI